MKRPSRVAAGLLLCLLITSTAAAQEAQEPVAPPRVLPAAAEADGSDADAKSRALEAIAAAGDVIAPGDEGEAVGDGEAAQAAADPEVVVEAPSEDAPVADALPEVAEVDEEPAVVEATAEAEVIGEPAEVDEAESVDLAESQQVVEAEEASASQTTPSLPDPDELFAAEEAAAEAVAVATKEAEVAEEGAAEQEANGAEDTSPTKAELRLLERAAEASGELEGELDGEPAEAIAQRPEIVWPEAPATRRLLDTLRLQGEAALERLDRFAGRLSPSINRDDYLVLSPYVGDPRWREAMRMLKDDDCKEALALLTELVGEPDSDAEPAIAYAVARTQMCTPGKEAEGREAMSRLARLDDAVGELARERLGKRVRVRSSGADEDAEGMYLSEKLAEARARARKGEVDAALADLDALHARLTRSWDRFRCRRARAEIEEEAGRLDAAAKTYLAIYRRTRGWKINPEIEDEIERLERRTGKDILTYGERIDRMRHLISRSRYRDARKVSVQTAKMRGVRGDEIRGWSLYRQALQAEHQKKREEAARLFGQAEKLVKDSEVRPRLYFGWARALRRLDRDREAIALYERLCEEYADHHLCDDSTYEAGRLLQYLNEHQAAQEKFAAVVENYPDSDFVGDALWRNAFSLYLQGRYEEVYAPLEQIIAHHGNETDASELSMGLKATYWIGVAALKAGDRVKARSWLQRTIDSGTLTWYGRLAVARMEQAELSPRVHLPRGRLTKQSLENLSTLLVPKSERLEVAQELARLGLFEDALDEMKDQVAIHPVPEGAHRLLASIYLANGQPNWAHWIMKKHIDEAGPTALTLRDWGTAFPLDYMDLSHTYGTKYGVSPFLVQAIIRQESGFRPTVKSWAGAVGLMQLMPGTASYTARKFLEDTRYRRSELTKPETNVRLGAMYIRLHTAHTVDNVALALAGYNAGPAPLKSWIERYGDRELDAWVESITYREARGYVRKVFTSYITYSALYGAELPPLSLEVPAQLRPWGEVPEVEEVEEGEPVSVLWD